MNCIALDFITAVYGVEDPPYGLCEENKIPLRDYISLQLHVTELHALTPVFHKVSMVQNQLLIGYLAGV